jgi:hypothetical protein
MKLSENASPIHSCAACNFHYVGSVARTPQKLKFKLNQQLIWEKHLISARFHPDSFARHNTRRIFGLLRSR